jgi:hypothetical protein
LVFYRETPYSVRNYGDEIEQLWPLMSYPNFKGI